mmetsp:Transcript_39846/g.125172  ORF Transcript_39846/g.125172 Transcript_39846/m.125172 type:complete len:248 (-) Transcript_39846:666-1409(-)
MFSDKSLILFSSTFTLLLLSPRSFSSSLIRSPLSFTSFASFALFPASSSAFFLAARTSSSFPFNVFSSAATFFLSSSKSFTPAGISSPDFLAMAFLCSRLNFSARSSSFSRCSPATFSSSPSTSLLAPTSFPLLSFSCSSSVSQPEQLFSSCDSTGFSFTLDAENGRMICMLPPLDLLACDRVARSSSRSSVSFLISSWAVCRASTALTCSFPFSRASWWSSLAFSTRLSSTFRRVLHPRPSPPRSD